MTRTISPQPPVEFAGRIVMVGCGSVGQTILPLLRRHVALGPDSIIVLAADEVGRGVAYENAVPFFYGHLKPRSFRRLLTRYVRAGDLLLNLSVDVSSLDLVRFAAERGALYVDTSIEPWPGVFDNPMLEPRQRTNFMTRWRALALARELGADAPTAVVDHGANPGLVSHFVKRAMLDLREALRADIPPPVTREDWATLARDLGVTLIQVSERDTQASDKPKRPGEFVNTWSIDGLMDESMQPSEISYGTAEKHRPKGSQYHRRDSGTMFLDRPGAATYARSWTPSVGGFQGLMMSHDEVFSIGDWFSLRAGGKFTYRPTVMFVYHPCDDAMLSALELEGRGWQPQEKRRRLGTDIVTGMDELGVLLAGHGRNAYWYGSQLTIEEARRHVPFANATTLQVAAGALAALVWAIRNPRRGIVEADDIDFEDCLATAVPYLGRMVGEFTSWTPLQGRGELFEERLDADLPWQLQNVRSRQWRG
ncbi:MAG: saccharopine dehydrogenase NADP-binding domain-containing protein [Steroidobacteraceae bacterium]|nr:saccharopine dehydrogenase NADP-binding domain-containing protein [Steroidobacteraceae bacterium]